jgi:acyl dehydratase
MNERRELKVTFSQEQIDAYAEASGDRNPIHLDAQFARAAGLSGTIAHGMLQMGLLARVAGPPERMRRLSCRFSGMVRPGDKITFGAIQQGERVQLTAVNQDGRAVLTKAWAELFPEERSDGA